MNNQEIHNRIMRRVNTIHFLKQSGRIGVKLAIIILCLGFGSLFVSYGNVLANFSNAKEFNQVIAFTVSAITRTELTVQLISLTALIAGFMLIRDISKNVNSLIHLRKA